MVILFQEQCFGDSSAGRPAKYQIVRLGDQLKPSKTGEGKVHNFWVNYSFKCPSQAGYWKKMQNKRNMIQLKIKGHP